MIIKGFVSRSPRKIQGFFVIFLFLSSLLFSLPSFSQTAEAETNYAVCKACHTIGGGKLVGPDLKGVTEKYDEAWLVKFIQNSQALIDAGDPAAIKVWEENSKIPMPPNPQLNEEQVKDIILYIKNDGKIAASESAAVENEITTSAEGQVEETDAHKLLAEMKQEDARHMQTTFIVMIILIFISLFDLIVTKIVKWRWIHTIIILISLTIGGEVIFVEATSLGRQQYYQPDQPVWFSHKVHSGQNQIECEYCHFTADKSMHAGIPPVQVCLNCHNQVKEGKITGAEEIAKIHDSYNNGKPIEWVKVHNLPDHVYFNHAQHVNIGQLECEECHGMVEEMDEVIQVEDLSMRWCIDCHRITEVQFASNKFYNHYKQLHASIEKGEKSSVKVVDIGGEDCQKCHY